ILGRFPVLFVHCDAALVRSRVSHPGLPYDVGQRAGGGGGVAAHRVAVPVEGVPVLQGHPGAGGDFGVALERHVGATRHVLSRQNGELDALYYQN
ncbi:hypothetical protein ANANG_G00029090, partial [Anguilla anguilla]